MKRTIRYFLLTGIAFVQASCLQPEKEQAIENKTIHVKVWTVERESYRIPVVTTGLLGTAKEMKLSFKTGGIIDEIHVREGQACRKGQVLASLDLSEIRAQVDQARIASEKALRDLNRAGNLYMDSVVTLEQYQNARSAYELARAQKEVADFNLRHSTIKAPADGKIMKILSESNEIAAQGHPVLLYASTENDWVVRASLTDKDIVRLSMGDTSRVRMDAFPGSLFQGEVSELGTVADPVSGTYEVEVLLWDRRPQFRTGFISRVEILPAALQSSPVVPIEALSGASDHAASVFVFDGGKAVKTRVSTGRILGERVVILDGLEEGQQIITDGAGYLSGGETVIVENQP